MKPLDRQPDGHPPRHTEGERLRGLRILVVDDDGLQRELARTMLEQEGASIVEASNGVQAVALCLGSKAAFDAVLMDNRMPMLGGLQATAAIRSRVGPEVLPIIGLSSNTERADHDAAASAGMNDYLHKPFNLERVVSAVTRHRPR